MSSAAERAERVQVEPPLFPVSSGLENAPGTFSCVCGNLSEDEQEICFDLLGQQQSGRRKAERSAFAKELMNEPGNVGYDEAGNLIRMIGGGQIEIIEPASGQKKQPSDGGPLPARSGRSTSELCDPRSQA